MMAAQTDPTAFDLSIRRAIATSETQSIHGRHVAAQWILEKSPHEADKALARAVLADLETIAQIEVI